MKKVKGLALLSGGLDSSLAAKLLLNQGIEVTAIHVVSPFCVYEKRGCGASGAAEQLGIPLKVLNVGQDYLKVVRKPKYGYGKNINPCVDCRIFILKKAKKYAKEIGASFIFTGEVLDERPMSQHFRAMKIIEEEAGLKGKILRPLSAKLLPETFMEKKGMVDREKLLDIRGRSRKRQIKLAAELNIKDYPSPAGGCLLTCKEYAEKLRDLFNNTKKCSIEDISFLRVGRHFRFGKNKLIIGRNEKENRLLTEKKTQNDYYFEVPDVGSPTTILRGTKTKDAIRTAAELTAFYSDAKSEKVTVSFGRDRLDKHITVTDPTRAMVESLRIGNF
jgi:tRNA-uridine 2-sulfurtransferase